VAWGNAPLPRYGLWPSRNSHGRAAQSVSGTQWASAVDRVASRRRPPYSGISFAPRRTSLPRRTRLWPVTLRSHAGGQFSQRSRNCEPCRLTALGVGQAGVGGERSSAKPLWRRRSRAAAHSGAPLEGPNGAFPDAWPQPGGACGVRWRAAGYAPRAGKDATKRKPCFVGICGLFAVCHAQAFMNGHERSRERQRPPQAATPSPLVERVEQAKRIANRNCTRFCGQFFSRSHDRAKPARLRRKPTL
jgi:hypothetical protein